MNIFYFVLAGLFGGVLGGMGMGGGTILIPILTIMLGVAQKQAQFINLASFVVMGTVSLIIHMKNGLVEYKQGIILMVSGVISSVAGSLFVGRVSNSMLRFLFGTFLIEIAAIQLTLLIVRYTLAHIEQRKMMMLS